MGATLGRWHGVAIGMTEAVAIGGPMHRPFHLSDAIACLPGTGKGARCYGDPVAQRIGQIVFQATGEMQHTLWRDL